MSSILCTMKNILGCSVAFHYVISICLIFYLSFFTKFPDRFKWYLGISRLLLTHYCMTSIFMAANKSYHIPYLLCHKIPENCCAIIIVFFACLIWWPNRVICYDASYWGPDMTLGCPQSIIRYVVSSDHTSGGTHQGRTRIRSTWYMRRDPLNDICLLSDPNKLYRQYLLAVSI